MKRIDRKGAIAILLGGAAAAFVALVGREIWRFFHPPGPPPPIPSGTRVDAGPENRFLPGNGTSIPYGSRSVLVVRTVDGGWRAFDGACSHKGCSVRFAQELGQIVCPCHDGRFDLEGRVLSGPPPRPLSPLAIEIRGGRVIVTKRG